MADIGKRLRKLRVELDLNQGEFAERIEIVQSALSAIESGRKPLTDRNLKLICFEFGVNETWLRTGIGDMLSQKPTPPVDVNTQDDERLLSQEEEIFITTYKKLTEPNKIVAKTTVEALLKAQRTVPTPEKEQTPGIGLGTTSREAK